MPPARGVVHSDEKRSMSSASLQNWRSVRRSSLDDMERAHRSVGGSGPGRRHATEQINYAYAIILSSQFQGYCRDLHSECANDLVQSVAGPLRTTLLAALVKNRKLDRGNPNPGNIGSDFNSFGLIFWDEVKSLDLRNQARQNRLGELNEWRNAIAHQDFTKLPEGPQLQLKRVKTWRAACDQLAVAFDDVMRRHIQTLNGAFP